MSKASSDIRTYVVALERNHRHDAPPDWIERVRGCDGVSVQEPVTARRIVVKASVRGAAAIRRRLYPYLLVEELVSHEIA